MGFLSFLKGAVNNSVLGVDIGTTSIKIAEIESSGGGFKLNNYGLLDSSAHLVHPNKVLQTSGMKIYEDEAADLLAELVAKMNPGTQNAVASIAPFTAFTTTVDMPRIEDKDMQSAMEYQAKQYVPIPISEVAVDWFKVGEHEDDKGYYHQQILLICVPKDQISRMQAVFKRANLNLSALELENFALVRSAVGRDPLATLIIDIGSRSTSFTFCENGDPRYIATTDYAGSSLTQALSQSLSINPIRAEELKKDRGISSVGAGAELSTIMLPFVDVIISEARRAQYNYQIIFPSAGAIERVIL